jgi:hypothetical protein
MQRSLVELQVVLKPMGEKTGDIWNMYRYTRISPKISPLGFQIAAM